MKLLMLVLVALVAQVVCSEGSSTQQPPKGAGEKMATPYDKASEITGRVQKDTTQIWISFEAAKGMDKVRIGLRIAQYFAINERRRLLLLEFFNKVESQPWPSEAIKGEAGYLAMWAMALLGDSASDLKLLKLFAEQGALARGLPYLLAAGHAKSYIEDRGGIAYLIRLLESNNRELRELAWAYLCTAVFNGERDIKGKYKYDPAKPAKDQLKVLEQLRKLALEAKD